MKKKLISVFFGIYILLGVLGFFVVTYVAPIFWKTSWKNPSVPICIRLRIGSPKVIWSATALPLLIWKKSRTGIEYGL